MVESQMVESHIEPVEASPISLLRVVPPVAARPHAPLDLAGMQSELAHLQKACELHVSSLERVRVHFVQAAHDIARLIASSGLQGVRLPREYQVRYFQNELYLVKNAAEGAPLFVATGQDNMFTRMHLHAVNGLRPCDLAEFVEDLNQGLLGELTAYVACRLRAFDFGATSEAAIAPMEVPAALPEFAQTSPKLHLSTLGRANRRRAAA